MRITFLMEQETEESLPGLPGMKDLLEELKDRSIPWREIRPQAIDHGWQTEIEWDREDLAVTDCQEAACLLAERHICCVGYQNGNLASYFEGVQMVVQSFEGVDVDFFRCILGRFLGKTIVVGRTPRLILRESRAEDFEALYEISREKGNDRYVDGMTGEEDLERAAYLSYVRQMYGFYGFGLWTVESKETGAVVGRCGLSLPSQECDELRKVLEKRQKDGGEAQEIYLELGYLIGQKYQRRGYGLEAGREVLDFAFRRLGCQAVYAVIHNDNFPSAGLARKLGFSRLGGSPERLGKLELWRMRAG